MDNLVGRKFKHFKGGIYEFVCIAEVEAKAGLANSLVVIYKEVGSEKHWSRPYDEFFGSVEREGKTFKRFEPLP